MFESDWRELCTKSVRFCTLLVALPIPRVNSWFAGNLKPMDEYGLYRDLDLLKIAAVSIERVEFLSSSCSS